MTGDEGDSVSTFFRTIGGIARNSISVGGCILGRLIWNSLQRGCRDFEDSETHTCRWIVILYIYKATGMYVPYDVREHPSSVHGSPIIPGLVDE